ncbi:MAG: motility associated factor glycosyltransferase family protein, partial [Planctomycetes bacterium]|nr:motility associated factor glycosyltransferase family protein [Planctomycetota bacterium]
VGGGVGRMGGVPRSVAHLNYLVARTLGCDPIVLVGQDLAFGEDGRHYASGTVKDAQRTRGNEGSGVLEVEGNLGGHVRTTLLWDAMRTWFEEEVARPGGPRVLNATAGGARIRGVPPVDLGGVLDVLPSRPPRRLHECLARRAPGEARRRMGEARREASTRTEALVGDFGRLRAEVGEALAALAAWDRAAPVSPGHPAWRLTDRVLERLEALVPTDALPRSVLYPSIVALNQRMATHGALADVSALAGCLAEAEGFLRTGEEWLPRLAGVLGGSP